MKPNDLMDGKEHQKNENSRAKRCLSDSDRFDQLTVNVENLIHKSPLLEPLATPVLSVSPTRPSKLSIVSTSSSGDNSNGDMNDLLSPKNDKLYLISDFVEKMNMEDKLCIYVGSIPLHYKKSDLKEMCLNLDLGEVRRIDIISPPKTKKPYGVNKSKYAFIHLKRWNMNDKTQHICKCLLYDELVKVVYRYPEYLEFKIPDRQGKYSK